VRFHIRPGVLRVRIAHRHPGASPSAMLPDSLEQSIRALARIAAGRDAVASAAGEPVRSLSPQATQERRSRSSR
jgi:hypothetical protein